MFALGQKILLACSIKYVRRKSRIRSNGTALHHFCHVLISQVRWCGGVMWVGVAPHWLHATSLPEVGRVRVHQSNFTFFIDLNTETVPTCRHLHSAIFKWLFVLIYRESFHHSVTRKPGFYCCKGKIFWSKMWYQKKSGCISIDKRSSVRMIQSPVAEIFN
jgi:hypothetical protein